MRIRKTPAEIRKEVAGMIRYEANCAEGVGDPEGAGRLRDLASLVDRIRLTKDSQPLLAEIDRLNQQVLGYE